MKIQSFSRAGLCHQLENGGLRLKTGPFVFSIHSKLDVIALGIHALYDEFPVVGPDIFADFHITIRHARGLRGFIRPQSVFEFDGQVPFKPLAGNQAFALLEWGMNWCIYNHAHHFLIIHGAVLERSGCALIMPAPSGSGKSTLCAALMNRGWRLLSDELVLIDPQSGVIHGLGRPVSLKNRSIDVLSVFAPSAVITAPIHDTAKGTVAHMKPSRDSVERNDQTALPAWILFPRYESGATTSVSALRKADVFMRLIENSFNYSILREKGFDTLSALVSRSSSYEAHYSDLEDIIRHIDDLLLEERVQ